MVSNLKQSMSLSVTVFMVAIVLISCGKSSSNDSPVASSSTTTNTASVVQEVDCSTITPDKSVAISGFSFNPASVTISANNVVKWTNNDGTTHTVTGGTPGTPDNKFDVTLNASATKCLRFTSAGSYAYYCNIHRTMTGAVTVQ
jgi:plastocyanin